MGIPDAEFAQGREAEKRGQTKLRAEEGVVGNVRVPRDERDVRVDTDEFGSMQS